MIDGKRLFAGIDVGSLTAEALIMDEDGEIRASRIIRVRPSSFTAPWSTSWMEDPTDQR